MLVDHLVELGHDQIAHATGGAGPNADARRDQYLVAIKQHGLQPDVIESAYTEEAGFRTAETLLARPQLPTALIAANDRCAVGVLMTLARRGVEVPRDMSIVGFDDSSVARLPFVQLTTVRHDPASLAAEALTALIRRIEDPDAPVVTYQDAPELIVRQSSGPRRPTL
ncbi:hypothetical protein GCM10025780_29310 [Frondihabitans cladoniiphilus]|uniref:Transcriptional regulator LacI/GalR-like sensor domain-containing protein n=1 Tax=Frondihabitans cladoniiphilus TaxID=715785 RepID=A0ABP8W662_9MICO